MGMSTDHGINTARVLDELHIADIFCGLAIRTEVTETNDNVAFFRPQGIHCFLGGFIWVKVLRRQEVLIRDQAFRVTTKTQDADLQPTFTDDNERLCLTFHRCAGEIIVGAYDRKRCGLQHRRQGVQTIIKLMVTERRSIITHMVHGINLYSAVVEIEVRRTLAEIAGIDQQQVLIRLPFPLNQPHTPRVTSLTVSLGFYLRVRIIRMQDRQMIRLRRTCYQKDKRTKYKVQKNSFHSN